MYPCPFGVGEVGEWRNQVAFCKYMLTILKLEELPYVADVTFYQVKFWRAMYTNVQCCIPIWCTWGCHYLWENAWGGESTSKAIIVSHRCTVPKATVYFCKAITASPVSPVSAGPPSEVLIFLHATTSCTSGHLHRKPLQLLPGLFHTHPFPSRLLQIRWPVPCFVREVG